MGVSYLEAVAEQFNAWTAKSALTGGVEIEEVSSSCADGRSMDRWSQREAE